MDPTMRAYLIPLISMEKAGKECLTENASVPSADRMPVGDVFVSLGRTVRRCTLVASVV